LELTTFHAFFQSAKNGIKKAHQKNLMSKELLVSGPFKPVSWAHHNVLVAEKNPTYWNAPAVKFRTNTDINT